MEWWLLNASNLVTHPYACSESKCGKDILVCLNWATISREKKQRWFLSTPNGHFNGNQSLIIFINQALYPNNIRHFDSNNGEKKNKTFPRLKHISRIIAEVDKKTVGQNVVHSIELQL